jgi:hypothetical protein
MSYLILAIIIYLILQEEGDPMVRFLSDDDDEDPT